VGSHPANLLLRFVLELAALATFAWWGYRLDHLIFRWVLAVALPIAAAALWAVFAVPGDPSRSGRTVVATAGRLRLLGELAFFGAAVAALWHRCESILAVTLGAAVLLHHAASYDRIAWLLRR
jgi:hypothetical protein